MPTVSPEPKPAMRAAAASMQQLLAGTSYVSYSYGYPHKTAYRALSPRRLQEVWNAEPRDALFLYVHIPFCSVRCGFCNLLATTGAEASLVRRYIDTLERQAVATREAVGRRTFVRAALGGGTPTFLQPAELRRVLDVMRNTMGADLAAIPTGVEVSPETTDGERLAVLQEFGVDRVSIGVQSFDQREAGAMGRPQRDADVHRALRLIRDHHFPTLNIDLIYGGADQTTASWLASIRAAIEYRPEELYLYPLYVRPLTGLGRRGQSWDEQRISLYRAGRDFLLEQGYQQVSMRMFRAPHAPTCTAPVYCCQQDGMVGLGAGARSYTRELHYSTRYAVGRAGVSAVIEDYVSQDAAALATVDYGFEMDDGERRRRFVIQSLLQAEGLSRTEYRGAFGSDALNEMPALQELQQHALATVTQDRVCLTPAGLERSDAIGPWLYSARVGRLMEEFAWT